MNQAAPPKSHDFGGNFYLWRELTMLKKIISAIIIAIADVLRGGAGHGHKRM